MRSLALVLGMAVFGAVGCAANEAEEEQSSQSDRLAGTTSTTPRTIVSLQVRGGTVRTGVLVANDILVTSARWVTETTSPGSITIRMPHAGGNDFVTTGTHVNVHPKLGFAAIRLAQPVSLPADTIGFRGFITKDPLAGMRVTCHGYANEDGRTQKWVWRVVGDQSGDGVTMVPSADGGEGIVYDGDAGMPCIDDKTGLIVGLAAGAPAKVNASSPFTMVSGAALKPWIDAMKNLGVVRNAALAGGQGPVRFRDSRYGRTFCMNVTSLGTSDMNEWTCDGRRSQLFWIRAVGAQVALVSDHSGLCVDVLGSGTANGTVIQQAPCHYGTNQTYDFIPVGTGYFIDPAHIPHYLPGPGTGNGNGMTIAASVTGIADGTPLVLRSWSFAATPSSGRIWEMF